MAPKIFKMLQDKTTSLVTIKFRYAYTMILQKVNDTKTYCCQAVVTMPIISEAEEGRSL